MTELTLALARVAGAEQLLVASDFDGTLAPIADLPGEVRVDPEACRALQAIGELPNTHAAIVSGRSRDELRRLLGGREGEILLVGSHGAELETEAVLSSSQLRLLDELARDLREICGQYRGALVERKPVGLAFHYRRVPAEAQEEAAGEVLEGPGRRSGVRVQEGRRVVELVVVEANKGLALQRLRESFNVTATFFLGDNRTDENAFVQLGPFDLGVKVGHGPTEAAARIERQSDVAPLLRRLYGLRAKHVTRVTSIGS